MTDKNSAAAADNAVADSLDGSDFDWGLDESESADSDGGIVTDESELSDNEIVDTSGTGDAETQEGLGEQPPAASGGKAPAAAQGGQTPPAPAAGNQSQPQTQAQTPQATANEPPAPRQPAFHEVINANFDKAVDHLAGQGTFRLAPQDADKFDDDTRQVLERQSAAVYLKSVATFSEILHTTLPAVVQSLIGVTNSGEEQERNFYQTYGFDKAQHDMGLRTIMHNVRSLHPGATRQQIMDETARIAYVMLNVTPPVKKPAGGSGNGNGGAKPAGKREISRQAFAPAAKAGGGAPQARKAPGTPAQKVDPMIDLANMLNFGGDLPD